MRRYPVRAIFAACVLLAALAAGPVRAAPNPCMSPEVPSVPDGKTAAGREMIEAANLVRAYIAESDRYQQCLNTWLAGEMSAAVRARKKSDPRLKEEHDRLGDANQKEKEGIGALYNDAQREFRAAHPR